jgi:hypothetical protein
MSRFICPVADYTQSGFLFHQCWPGHTLVSGGSEEQIMRIFRRAVLFFALMSLAVTGFADILRLRSGVQISGFYEGGTPRVVRFRTDSGVQEFDILTVSSVQISGTSPSAEPDRTVKSRPEAVSSFGPEQEQLIREWFSRNGNYSNLPPGLAKRDRLPPGLERQLQRNGTLPPGLQKRVQPLPFALEQQLPPVFVGMRRVILAGNVILLDETTARIVDLIRDVF